MSYNTYEEFMQLGPLSGSFDNISQTIVEDNLNSAASKIDSVLNIHHTLPLSPIPYDVKLNERFIAAYWLTVVQGVDSTQDGTDRFLSVYQDIVAKDGWLDKVSSGKIKYTDSAVASDYKNNIKVFSQRGKRGYTVDDK